MATVAVSTDSPVIQARPERGRLRILADENVGFLGTWLRLIWRHWPVLLALGLAGTLLRELLIRATFWASQYGHGFGTWLVFPLVPIATLLAMVLILRVVRPSLPYLGRRATPEPLGVYLAAVTIPFLVFYFADDVYFQYDFRRVLWLVGQDILGNAFAPGPTRYVDTTPAVYLVLGGGAFVLRAIAARIPYVRRSGLFAIPLLYLEIMWLYLTFTAVNRYLGPERGDTQAGPVRVWLEETRAWQTVQSWWHTQLDPGNPLTPLLAPGRNAINVFLDAFDLVIVAPVTGLIAGAVVLAARTRYRDEALEPPTGLRRLFAIGATAGRPVGGRFGMIADGVRRIIQAGIVATLVFCVVFVALKWVSPLLFDLERLVIGPQDVGRVWEPLYFPLWYFNDAVGLMLMISLIAAFVDRNAARIARRAGAPVGPPSTTTPAPTAAPAAVVPEQATMRLGPPPTGGATPGTPSYAGLSPVRPTYTPVGQPAPTFGTTFGTGPGLTPPPPGGPPATPPAGLTSGLWDRQLDEPGQLQRPRDDEFGGSGIGR